MNAQPVADTPLLMQDVSGVASPSSQPATTTRLVETEPEQVAGVQSYAQRWFVARHKPWDGLGARDRVRASGFKAILPRQVIRQHQRDEVIRPVFLGYLLVSFDLSAPWGKLLRPDVGLLSIITHPNLVPAQLPAGFVEDFMAPANSDGVFPYWWPDEEPKTPAQRVGKSFKVETGPWAGFIGECTTVNKNKSTLLLSLLGRSIPTEFRAEQLREVE